MKNFKNIAINFIKKNKLTLGLLLVILAVVGGGVFAYQKLFPTVTPELPVEEIEMSFDPEGPYALLEPRRDGYALNLRLFRVSSYDSINYEISYQATGTTAGEEFGTEPIDRGALGTIDNKSKKSEFNQEILFGTCSQGYTSGTAHCVFDKNVENGHLTLRIKKTPEKGDTTQKVYKMSTSWHLQKPDVALGNITSSDKLFSYKTTAPRDELVNIAYTIINDLTAAPKIPAGKTILGKVYALNTPTAKNFTKGVVTVELLNEASTGTKIARFNQSKNDWEMLDTKIESGKLTASSESGGVFAVLTDAK